MAGPTGVGGAGPGAARLRAPVLPLALLVTAAGAATGPSNEQPLPAGDVVRLVDGASAPALGAVVPAAPPARVEGDVRAAFEEDERVPVIVRLREQVDLPTVAAEARAAGRARGRADRVHAVVDALKQKAERTQPGVRGLLRDEESAGCARDVRSFWIFNGLSATVSRATLGRLAEHPAVESIELDEELTLPETTSAPRALRWDAKDARYHANFGRPSTGGYRLRALLVVEGWNVQDAGPEIHVGPSTTAEVPAGAATG